MSEIETIPAATAATETPAREGQTPPPPGPPSGPSKHIFDVDGSATTQFPVTDDLLTETATVTVDLKNDTKHALTIGTSRSELRTVQQGGWVDKDVTYPLFGAGGVFPSLSSIPTGTSTATLDLPYVMPGTTHALVRVHAHGDNEWQYEQHTLPMLDTSGSYSAPADLKLEAPVFIGTWRKPAEIFRVFSGGAETRWLTIGGQIVNGTGGTIQVKTFSVKVVMGNTVLVHDVTLPTFYNFESDGSQVAVPVVNGAAEMAEVLNFFVVGWDMHSQPSDISAVTVTIKAEYVHNGDTKTAVWRGPVEFVDAVSLPCAPLGPAPKDCVWSWGNAPDKTAWDSHSWPLERFSYDIVAEAKDPTGTWRSSPLGSDPHDNNSYYAYGQPVLACADGVVVETEFSDQQNHGSQAVPNLQGINKVVIRHKSGAHAEYSGYYHLKPETTPPVTVGQQVNAGDVIGHLGNSGGSSEPHLHFGYLRMDQTGRTNTIPMKFADLWSADVPIPVLVAPGNGRYQVIEGGKKA